MTTSMRRAAMTIFFSIGAAVFRLSITGKNFFARYRLGNEEREKPVDGHTFLKWLQELALPTTLKFGESEAMFKKSTNQSF